MCLVAKRFTEKCIEQAIYAALGEVATPMTAKHTQALPAKHDSLGTPRLPAPLPGYEHIKRYWDHGLARPVAKLLPGEIYVSQGAEVIATTLGSCVAACIRDCQLGIGGMNHFMLPARSEFSEEAWGGDRVNSANRYGNWAMACLINEIVQRGGQRQHMEIKLFGGGNVLGKVTDIGRCNIEFVRHYLQQEKLAIAASDLGDIYPRRVLYFPDTGSVKVKKLKQGIHDSVLQNELRYRANLQRDATRKYQD